jgi:hypothetical protein
MYDNEQGCYVYDEAEMQGLWLVDPRQQVLYIMPNQDGGIMENIGPDDPIMDRINELCREDVDHEAMAEILNREYDLQRIPDGLKRFEPKWGYYYA